MKHQIASAFCHRPRPAIVTNVAVNSTLRDDARHFEGMDWTQATAKDWVEYSDAYYGLSREAFAYFLPSLLIASLEANDMPLIAADALVSALDTSADPNLWSDWFRNRFLCLAPAELRTIRDWSEAYLAFAEKGPGTEYARVQDTIEMLILMAEG